MERKKNIKNNLDRKKGFTLIEIIISIVLIVLIGGATTFLLINKKDDKKEEVQEKTTNQILEAADVYVNSLKDEKGNSFLKEISKGAKGVKIPLSLLVNKGLIDEKVIDDIDDYMAEKHSSYTRPANESYYILYLQGGTVEGVNYCEQDSITIASWTMEENETIYLCNDYEKESDDNTNEEPEEEPEPNIVDAQRSVRLKADLTKFAVSQDFYNRATKEQKEHLTAAENGVFTFYNETTGKTFWYYRGAVNNNYLKFGKYKNTNEDLYWRILWMNDKNEMKIILDNTIPLSFKNSLNQSIPVGSDTTLYRLYKSDVRNQDFYYYNQHRIAYEREGDRYKGYDVFYTYKVYNNELITKDVWQSLYNIDDSTGVYTSNTFWVNNNLSWYNSTNLSSFSYILNKNLCSNLCDSSSQYWEYGDPVTFAPSNNFECFTGSKTNKNGCKYAEYTASSNKVGFLTYGEAIRAGIISNGYSIDISNSENYLVKSINNYNILIGDKKETVFYSRANTGAYEEEFTNYYYNSKGISYGKIKNDERGTYDDTYYYYYTLVDENDKEIVDVANNQGKVGYKYYQEKFIANALKPTLTINMSNIKLSGEGTEESPFELVNK